jgi:cytoskeletal protein CcmA (bactofilin family)
MMGRKRRKEPAISTLVGTDTRVHGDIEFNGGCLVDGYVNGHVKSVGDETATLSISERGCVEGGVDVPNVLLNGTVNGDVRTSQRIELGSNARVVGNVEYNLIEMAIGAEVNGKLIHKSEAGRSDGPVREPATSESAEPQRGPAPVAHVNLIGESS